MRGNQNIRFTVKPDLPFFFFFSLSPPNPVLALFFTLCLSTFSTSLNSSDALTHPANLRAPPLARPRRRTRPVEPMEKRSQLSVPSLAFICSLASSAAPIKPDNVIIKRNDRQRAVKAVPSYHPLLFVVPYIAKSIRSPAFI